MLSIFTRDSASKALAYYEHLEADNQLEDYYAQEAAGRYFGGGAAALGLVGRVQREEFAELAEGRTPIGDVQNAGEEGRRSGTDMTASAPKSVSIMWALADKVTREMIERAHDLAVDKMLRFVEQNAAYTRRGSGRSRDEDRRERVGIVAAVYRHGTSRAQDPQLHSHCFVFNVSPRSDGTVGALDTKPLYQWRMAAGAVYQAELAEQMRALGYEVLPDGRCFRLANVPNSLETEFSQRRGQINAALAERGASGAKAAEIAALDTRTAKEVKSPNELHQNWQQRALARAPEWRAEPARETLRTETRQNLSAAELLMQLTRDKSTFSRANLYEAAATNHVVAGGGIAAIEASISALEKHPELVVLKADGEQRYTTREMLTLETKMVDLAAQMSRQQSHGISQKYHTKALEAYSGLSAEQIRMLEHVTSPSRLSCVQGGAGTGKSYALGAAREAWEGQGYRVRGASLSGKAAAELEKGSGIKSTTLARLAIDAGFNGQEVRDPLTSRDILVVDEAGMSGSRQLSKLLEEADRAGTKVVLVGDTRQLQAIEAGGAFRAIQERVGRVELVDIRRQHSIEDREVVQAFREGRAGDALDNLAERGRVHGYVNGREAKEAAGRAVAADIAEGKSSIVLAGTRAEARDVNLHARQAARELGLLRGDDLGVNARAGWREFAAGERVLFTRNSRHLDVKNGDLGTIKEQRYVNGKTFILIALDRGEERVINPEEYDHLDYGYAVTGHKSQGSTVDRAHVVAADQGMASREWAYVAGSRHRESLHIYADKATLSELAPSWSKARQKDVSIDYEPVQVSTANQRDQAMEIPR